MLERQQPGRLLLTIHHLAIDGVSWRILLPDLAAAWAAIAGRQDTGARAAGHVVSSLGATACGRGAGSGTACGAFVLDWDVESRRLVSLVEGALDRERDVSGRAGQLTLTCRLRSRGRC